MLAIFLGQTTSPDHQIVREYNLPYSNGLNVTPQSARMILADARRGHGRIYILIDDGRQSSTRRDGRLRISTEQQFSCDRIQTQYDVLGNFFLFLFSKKVQGNQKCMEALREMEWYDTLCAHSRYQSTQTAVVQAWESTGR